MPSTISACRVSDSIKTERHAVHYPRSTAGSGLSEQGIEPNDRTFEHLDRSSEGGSLSVSEGVDLLRRTPTDFRAAARVHALAHAQVSAKEKSPAKRRAFLNLEL